MAFSIAEILILCLLADWALRRLRVPGLLEKREAMAHELSAKLAKVWVFAEIILFALVGAQVKYLKLR